VFERERGGEAGGGGGERERERERETEREREREREKERKRERPLDGTSHGPVASPLLSVGEVGDSVEVGGDELAARVFVDAQLLRVV